MSVMQCDRMSCNNIMCNRHSPDFGYICDQCAESLVDALAEGRVTTIAQFMQSPKNASSEDLRAGYRLFVDRVFEPSED